MHEEFIKGSPLPESVGLSADLYADVRALRLAMQKEVDAVAEREKEIKAHIIDNLSKSEDTGAAGHRFRAQIKKKEVPKADDWDAIKAFIVKHDRFDLLQRRLNNKAIAEMWEAGQTVDGVGTFSSLDVSITKNK